MNGSFVGGWGVVMLVAVAACGQDDGPQPVPPAGSSADEALNPVGEDPGTATGGSTGTGGSGAGGSGAVPSRPSTEAPAQDLAPPVASTDNAPAAVADGGARDRPGDAGVAPATEEQWTTLFNGENLDGWTVSRGTEPGQTAEEIFQVTDGMLHVYRGAAQGSAQSIATIRTNDSYGNYVFQFEYLWGDTRFVPRANVDRDAGILFHLFNDLNAVWPDSLEFQMGSSPLNGEWVSGDIFMIGSLPRAQTTGILSGNNFVFAEPEMGGMRRSIGAPNGYERGRTNVRLDRPTEWNTIELTVRGATEAEFKLNGVVVNRLFDMERNVGGGVFQPLDSGPIALQAEYAELFYRNIRLRELPDE